MASVCKRFLNTLGITQRTLRTAVQKVSQYGVIEKDKRGGRSAIRKENDVILRELVEKHIDRYPRVESHYCRANSTREYLNSDLTLQKMYAMFLEFGGRFFETQFLNVQKSI